MSNLTVIRSWQFDQMRKSIDLVNHVIQSASEQDLKTLRDGDDGWTILEVLCHLRDFEAIFLNRAQATLAGGFPTLVAPDPDSMAKSENYSHQKISVVYKAWVVNRHNFLNYLESLDEDDWEKAGNHPRRGWFTLYDQLMLTTWHDMNHIQQMIKILDNRD